MSDTQHLVDTGDYLEVPPEERLEVDDVVEEEVALDQFENDFADVPDGDVVDLVALAAAERGEQ